MEERKSVWEEILLCKCGRGLGWNYFGVARLGASSVIDVSGEESHYRGAVSKMTPEKTVTPERNRERNEYSLNGIPVSSSKTTCYLYKINKTFFPLRLFFLFHLNLLYKPHSSTHFFLSLFLSQRLASLQSLPQLWCVCMCRVYMWNVCVHHERWWVA